MIRILVFVVALSFHYSLDAQRRIVIDSYSGQPPLLVASAGEDIVLGVGGTELGDTPTALGGLPPYAYSWDPSTNLNSPSVSNPIYLGLSTANYTVNITDTRGCVASDHITILATGISAPVNRSIVMYPNPSTGTIRLCTNGASSLSGSNIQLFTQANQLIYSAFWTDGQNDFILDVSHFAKGMYILVIGNETDRITKKLVISSK